MQTPSKTFESAWRVYESASEEEKTRLRPFLNSLARAEGTPPMGGGTRKNGVTSGIAKTTVSDTIRTPRGPECR